MLNVIHDRYNSREVRRLQRERASSVALRPHRGPTSRGFILATGLVPGAFREKENEL
jgi:hypothetical protein